MINILIADENIYYATNLMNYINKYNDSIRVLGITSNGKDTIEFLDNNNVDVFFLDIKMPIYNGIEILEKVQNKKSIYNLVLEYQIVQIYLKILLITILFIQY